MEIFLKVQYKPIWCQNMTKISVRKFLIIFIYPFCTTYAFNTEILMYLSMRCYYALLLLMILNNMVDALYYLLKFPHPQKNFNFEIHLHQRFQTRNYISVFICIYINIFGKTHRKLNYSFYVDGLGGYTAWKGDFLLFIFLYHWNF